MDQVRRLLGAGSDEAAGEQGNASVLSDWVESVPEDLRGPVSSFLIMQHLSMLNNWPVCALMTWTTLSRCPTKSLP